MAAGASPAVYVLKYTCVGVERSFSTMNRVCNRLRQRLTVEHLNDLLLIAQECPDQVTRDQLKEIVYTWYDVKPRRIQLPVRDRRQ